MKFEKVSKSLKKLPMERQDLALAIAIMNDKGGVGKTSITDALAHVAMRTGRRVLIIDLDPQCNISQRLGVIDYNDTDVPRVAELFTAIIGGNHLAKADELPVNVVYPVKHMKENRFSDREPGMLAVIAGSPECEILASTAKHIKPGGQAVALLGEVVEHLKQYYDLIIIDTAPGIHDNAINEMTVAVTDSIVVPFDGSEAVLGIGLFMRWLKYTDKERKHSPLFVLSKYQADTMDIKRALGIKDDTKFEGAERSCVFRIIKSNLGDFVCDNGIQELRVLRNHTFIGMTTQQRKPYVLASKEILQKTRMRKGNSMNFWYNNRVEDKLVEDMEKIERSRHRNVLTTYGKIQHLQSFKEDGQ